MELGDEAGILTGAGHQAVDELSHRQAMRIGTAVVWHGARVELNVRGERLTPLLFPAIKAVIENGDLQRTRRRLPWIKSGETELLNEAPEIENGRGGPC